MSKLRYELLQENIMDAAEALGPKPIVNINLVTFHPSPDAPKLFQEYFRALRGLIATVGGKVVYSGEVVKVEGQSSLIHPWEAVAIVYYPSITAYQKVIAQDAFLSIKHMRKASLKWSVLYAATGPAHTNLESRPYAVTGGTARLVISRKAVGVSGDVLRAEGQRLLVGEAGYAPWRYYALTRDLTTPIIDDALVTLSLRDVPPDSQQLRLSKL